MVSDFTKEICRSLCAEKAIENEIRRLEKKRLEMIATRGNLSDEFLEDDAAARAVSNYLMDIAEGK